MRRAFLAALLGLALSSCVTPDNPVTYSGVWEWQFETSSFTTDRGIGPYWLVAEGSTWSDLSAPIRASGQGPWGRVAIVVQGTLTSPGHYGHMGAYSRELHVSRVLEAHLISASPQPSGS